MNSQLEAAQQAYEERPFCFWRSEEMKRIKLTMNTNDRNLMIETIRALGKAEIVQLDDHNETVSITQRAFKTDVAIAFECERHLRNLRAEVIRMNDLQPGCFCDIRTDEPELSREAFIDDQRDGPFAALSDVQHKLQSWYSEVERYNDACSKLKIQIGEVAGRCEVLKAADENLRGMEQARVDVSTQADNYPGAKRPSSDRTTSLLDAEGGGADSSQFSFQFLTGIIDRSKSSKLAHTLYRALRGYAVTKYRPVDEGQDHYFVDPTSDNLVPKDTFVVFFHGNQSLVSIRKICAVFGAKVFPENDIPRSASVRRELQQEALDQIRELEDAICETDSRKIKTLGQFYRLVREMTTFVFEEKTIFATLNKFRWHNFKLDASTAEAMGLGAGESYEGRTIECEGWVPAAAVQLGDGGDNYMEKLLEEAGRNSAGTAPAICTVLHVPEERSLHMSAPPQPTLLRTNCFTSGTQAIVDGYGIPRYQEINPGFFAVAMFPFLFGVMFGDMIHGFLMMAGSLLLIKMEKAVLADYKNQNEIFLMMFDGRYTMLMCGIAATYMGFIYNEGLSVAFNIFGSAYDYESFPEYGGFGSVAGVYVNCLAGGALYHDTLYGAFGNGSCKFSSLAVSSKKWDNGTHGFLPSMKFGDMYGPGTSTSAGGGTFPSMWCNEETKGASTSNVLFSAKPPTAKISQFPSLGVGRGSGSGTPTPPAKTKTYAYGTQSCPDGVYNVGGSYDPLTLAPCETSSEEDIAQNGCFNYTAFGFVPNGTKRLDNYHELVQVNKLSQGLTHLAPYPFGVDPVWRHANEMISFTNSLKMKMAVIIGVSQMTFGILLKIINFIHAKQPILILAVGIPELLFMTCTFGYMCALCFIKWNTNYATGLGGTGPECFDTCQCPWTGFGSDPTAPPNYAVDSGSSKAVSRVAPGIVASMLSMFGIPSFKIGDPGDCEKWLYDTQDVVQLVLIIIAVVSVPWLLFTEPCLIKCEHDRQQKEQGGAHSNRTTTREGYENLHDIAAEGDYGAEQKADGDDEEEFSLADIFVRQAIHTIEFVLGCVSNTASYLRLWALSLAHSQLSEVFWEYIMMGYEIGFSGMNPGLAGGTFFTIICYPIFFVCTMAVLMGMESLSAFLHALRLQWVEFQGKFYAADGKKFTPLTFNMALAAEED